jgi:SAM-dependent methyltransferase
MARLGVGDLHPGGGDISSFLVDELVKAGARRVLDVGAGIGVTTERLLSRGLQVTALEPNPVLRATIERRLGLRASAIPFARFDCEGQPYDAIVAESVLYALDFPGTFARAAGLLRAGGLLAFSEMLWTERASPEVTAFIHDQTTRAFGIPMAPRSRITWRDWRGALADAGFAPVTEREVAGSGDGQRRWPALARGLARRPWLLPALLTYRSYMRLSWAPPGWLESRAAVWKRA